MQSNLLKNTEWSSEADRAACRELIRHGSKSFHAASFLLPRRVRDDALALYAFCRIADDLVDETDGGSAAISRLKVRLDRVYDHDPEDSPVDRAMTDVVVKHNMPRELPEALIEGLEWDFEGRTFETLPDVYAYGARVAGSVGVMMSILMGVRSRDLLARACDLGVAMQLTNIARDVGEDARMGRIYLPRTWLRDAGIDPDRWLANPQFSPALGDVVERLLICADRLYERADTGILGLPLRCRPGIMVARRLYHAIGVEVSRAGHDSVSDRAHVSAKNKLKLVGSALSNLMGRASPHHDLPPLAETAFLVHAGAMSAAADTANGVISNATAVERFLWLAELFVRLEQREAAQRANP